LPPKPIDELKALVNTYRITVQGHADYQIPGKLRCPIHLFRASEQMTEKTFEDTREAWGRMYTRTSGRTYGSGNPCDYDGSPACQNIG